MPDSLDFRSESPEDIDTLEELLSFVPPPLQHEPESEVPTPDSSPVTFYDKHLDDSLILKQVKVLPGLIYTLSEALDDHISSFKSQGKPFHSTSMALKRHVYNKDVVATASDVSERYCEGGYPFIQTASVLAFHPDQPELMTVFSMSLNDPQISTQNSTSLNTDTRKGRFGLSLDDDRRALLLTMRKSLPHLTVYEAYALSGKTVLEDMSGLSGLPAFPWKRGGGSRYRQSLSHQVVPTDVSKYLWGTTPANSTMQVLDSTRFRRSERLERLAPTTSSTSKNSDCSMRPARKAATPTHIIITPKTPSSHEYRASPADFVQRAWVQAVDFDSTVIIFDCGNYFRVGVGHRKTQTLYISDLVGASSRTDPAYGKVITAINLAIIRDTMDRTPLLDSSLHKNKPSPHSTLRKRQRDRDNTGPVRRSRRRLGEPNKEVEPEDVLSF
ncbi:hypothetical protein ARMSODRAFT_1022158 [Armillaria solidipes]|uniref:Uncharacterized protein n=1 Tax=Armillaria solidipes TaxID=1076256 RepID=A0A2H3BA21_9AGAR|nr:hypothetical protein ARMSODRAFT_1022158 [Armillaria solidipes]